MKPDARQPSVSRVASLAGDASGARQVAVEAGDERTGQAVDVVRPRASSASSSGLVRNSGSTSTAMARGSRSTA